jgi:hypothetical protein
VFGIPPHIDLKAEYEIKGHVHGHICAIQGLTSASAEMAISSEKNADRQWLHWGINIRTVEGSNMCCLRT